MSDLPSVRHDLASVDHDLEVLAETHARLQDEIAQRAAVEESLRQTQAVLELALGAANVSLWSWNLQTNEAWASPRYWTHLGYDPQEVTSSFDLWLSMLHPDDRPRMLESAERMVTDPGPDFRSEFRLRRRDGSYCWLMSIGSVVQRDEQGRPIVITGCHLDITEQRRLEERVRQREGELAHAARLYVLGELVTGLSHELEQPLSAIAEEVAGCRAALAHRDTARTTAGLRRISTSALRAADIVRRLRRLVRKEPSERTLFDLASTLEEATEFIAHQTRHDGITLVRAWPEELPPLEGDPVQIEQVALNLLRNAVDSVRQMPKGRRRIEILVRPTPDEVVVDIGDSGPGLDPDDLPRLFDVLFTKRRTSLGMGLAVSRTIIESHGGKLTCESWRPGQAVYRFTLPRLDQATGGAER